MSRGTERQSCRCTASTLHCRVPGILPEEADVGGSVSVLIVPFVRSKDVNLVLDDWTPEAQRRKRSLIVGLHEVLIGALKRILRHHSLILKAKERITMPLVTARLSRCRNYRARCFLVFGLEILTDDAVLVDGIPGKGISRL